MRPIFIAFVVLALPLLTTAQKTQAGFVKSIANIINSSRGNFASIDPAIKFWEFDENMLKQSTTGTPYFFARQNYTSSQAMKAEYGALIAAFNELKAKPVYEADKSRAHCGIYWFNKLHENITNKEYDLGFELQMVDASTAKFIWVFAQRKVEKPEIVKSTPEITKPAATPVIGKPMVLELFKSSITKIVTASHNDFKANRYDGTRLDNGILSFKTDLKLQGFFKQQVQVGEFEYFKKKDLKTQSLFIVMRKYVEKPGAERMLKALITGIKTSLTVAGIDSSSGNADKTWSFLIRQPNEPDATINIDLVKSDTKYIVMLQVSSSKATAQEGSSFEGTPSTYSIFNTDDLSDFISLMLNSSTESFIDIQGKELEADNKKRQYESYTYFRNLYDPYIGNYNSGGGSFTIYKKYDTKEEAIEVRNKLWAEMDVVIKNFSQFQLDSGQYEDSKTWYIYHNLKDYRDRSFMTAIQIEIRVVAGGGYNVDIVIEKRQR